MKPTFPLPSGSYFGGKGAAGVVHHIVNQIPKHEVFVSGFLGRCAVMKWKKPAAVNIGIDLDGSIIEQWQEAAEAAQVGLSLIEGDFLNWNTGPLYPPQTFIYLDPPYLLETRTSKTRYRYDLTYNEHLVLLNYIQQLPCMIAISCYDNEVYQAILKGWRKIQFQGQTRSGQSRTETLYMNYPQPTPAGLHDPRFLGANFRAREKGKRRIETIQRKIERLEPTEAARLSDWLRGLVASQENAGLATIANSSEARSTLDQLATTGEERR